MRSIELARVFYRVEAETKGLEGQLKGAENSVKRLGNFILANPVAAAGALGVALVGIGLKAAEMAEKVAHSMRLIGASVKGTTVEVQALRGALVELSKTSGRTQADLAEAARTIAGGGVSSVGEIQAILAAGVRAADATGGDLSQILTGLDSVLDTFALSGEEAERVLAKLFVTAQGKTTLPELLTAFERLSPVAQKLGLSFEETAAAVATLISRGRTLRQITSELGQMDASAIRQLGASARTASSGIKELRDQADLMWNSVDNAGARAAAHWDAVMIRMGNSTSGLKAKILDLLATLIESSTSPLVRGLVASRPASGEPNLGRNGRDPNQLPPPPKTGLTEEEERHLAELKAEYARMVAGFTDSAVDDTLVQLRDFQAKLGEELKKYTGEYRDQLAAAGQAVIDGLRAKLQMLKALEAIQTKPTVVQGGPGSIPLRTDLTASNKELEDRTKALTEAEEELAAKRREALQDAARQAQAIEQAGRGALQLADAMGILSDEAAAAAQAVLQIATSASQLSKLSKLEGGASFGEMLGPILSIAGGLASLIGSLFGESPEERRSREVQQQNTDAIRELSHKIGALSGLSGTTVLGVQAATQATLGSQSGLGGTPNLFGLRAELAKVGLTMGDLKDVAANLGISFANALPSVSELKQLLDAIATSQLVARTDTFAGQLAQLQDLFEVFDITDPLEQLRKLVEVFNDPKFGSPALRQALAGLDLSTPEGRAAAEQAIQELVKRLGLAPDQGGISLGDLGGMSPEEFRQALLDLERRLDELGKSSGPQGETQGFAVSRTITEAQGSLVISQLGTIAYWQEQLYHLLDMRMLQPPSIIPGVPQGLTTIDLTVNVSLPGGATLESATAMGAAAGDAAAAKLNSLLGASLRTRKLLSGNVTQV